MHPGLCLNLQDAANEAFKDLLSYDNLENRLESALSHFCKDGINLDTASPETKLAVKRLINRDFNGVLEQRNLTKNAIEAVLRDKVIDESMPDFQTRGSVAG